MHLLVNVLRCEADPSCTSRKQNLILFDSSIYHRVRLVLVFEVKAYSPDICFFGRFFRWLELESRDTAECLGPCEYNCLKDKVLKRCVSPYLQSYQHTRVA